MHGVNAKKVIQVAALPGIIPRVRFLFGTGFGYVAYLMAVIYNNARLIPNNHKYLDPKNIGRYGIQHVVVEAANNLVLSRKNIDQMFIFFTLMMGIVIIVAQFLLLIVGILFPQAFAQSFFVTPESAGGNTIDIAFILMDQVFGVPNMFCAGNNGAQCTGILDSGRTPFHIALHEMLRFYSTGLLLIATMIFLYFVVVIVAETATSGSPFGQRFQNIWTPIRLVVALGLLVPLNYGLNSGQYLALYSAKVGSSLATNGWRIFNNAIATETGVFPGGESDPGLNPIGERETLIALPQTPDFSPAIQFMSMVHGCTYAEWRYDKNGGNPPPEVPSTAYTPGPTSTFRIKPYLVKNPLPWSDNQDTMLEVTTGTSYVDALDFYNNSDITIVFGEYDPEEFQNYAGGVKPTCGVVRITISDLKYKGEGDVKGGADFVQNFYYNYILSMWDESFGGGVSLAKRVKDLSYRAVEIELNALPELQCNIGCNTSPQLPSCPDDCEKGGIPSVAREEIVQEAMVDVEDAIVQAWEKYGTDGLDFDMENIMDRGWGGAGMWYNNISKIGGGFVTAVVQTPAIVQMPEIMEEAMDYKRTNDNDFNIMNRYQPSVAKEGEVLPYDVNIAKALYALHTYWTTGTANQNNNNKVISNNFFIDTVQVIFGLNGLLSIRGKNAHIHPLAQLTAVGKSLVDSAVRSIGGSIIAGFAGGLFDGAYGKVAQIASSFLSSTAFLGLTAGIVLYYVLPFLPFIYFFFAVAQWVKGIFEAMVGVPLWALAHLRIDGNGLPGDSAAFGYFLIFEIFARPIMIVFGLVASMVIFTAQVRILNFIWELVTDNLTGFERTGDTLAFQEKRLVRGVVDQFFFTVVYTIIVYMLASASFKLIDKIPDNILRWMGAGVSSFGDINTDPTEGLTRYAGIAGTVLGPQITKATQQAATGTGGALKGMLGQGGAPGGGQIPKPPPG